MEIILASASPRRKMLLEQLGLNFSINPSEIDESIVEIKDPQQLVQRLSYLKASSIKRNQSQIIIGADTVVSNNNKILEKPVDEKEAKRMLRKLSGTTHQVLTGITIINQDRVITDYESTDVQFKELTIAEIEDYVATGEPLDKAGSYGVQGQGAVLVKRIEGCFYNVVGLSLYRLTQMMNEIGLELELSG